MVQSSKRIGTRIVIGSLGFAAICLGLKPISRGDLFYQNWFSGFIFVPIAVIFGLVMILAAIFKPNYLGIPFDRDRSRHHR